MDIADSSYQDQGNKLAYCPPLSVPPSVKHENYFRDIEMPCAEQERLTGVQTNVTFHVASLDDMVKELNKKSVRIGIVCSEFWSMEIDGRMGGFGKAVSMVVKAFEKSQSSTALVFLHASKYSDKEKICEDRFRYLHGVPLIPLMSNRKCYRRLLKKVALEMVITIDFRVPYVRVLQDLPSSVAVVIWVHDPHTPEISEKLRANQIPSLNQSVAPSNVSPRSAAVKHELYFAEKVIFAVTTPSFVDRYPSAYNLESLLHYRTPVLPYAMDALASSRDPALVAHPHSSPRVIFIGRLDAVKRPWLFAETARVLPDVEFILLGQVYNFNDPIGFGFSEESKQPPNLKLLGHLDDVKTTEMLASSWILVSTAIHEGLPFNYIEALQLGVPIVATYDPANIASRFGIYVGNHPENSGLAAVPLLAKAIRELVADAPRRKSLGEAGKQWVNDVHSTEGFNRGIIQIRSQIKEEQFAPLQKMKFARTVGICATFLDEDKDLLEWLEFHKKIGVDFFYLYHLDNHSDPERWRHVLWPYVLAGRVKIHPQVVTYLGQKANRQSASLQNCYDTYKKEVDWLAFIDVDEYIVPKDADADLSVTLAAYRNESGVVLPWRTFGPIHINPSKRPFTYELTHATPYDERGGTLPRMAGTVKLILNTHHPHADYCNFFNIGTLFPKDNRLIHYVHNCLYLSPTPPVDERHIPVNDPWTLPDHHRASGDVLQLNHYFARSCFDFYDKKRKKLQSITARYGTNNIPKWFNERLGRGLGLNASAVCSNLRRFFNTTDESMVPIGRRVAWEIRGMTGPSLTPPARQKCEGCSTLAVCVDLLAHPLQQEKNKCVCNADYVGDGSFCGRVVWTRSVLAKKVPYLHADVMESKNPKKNPFYYMIGAPTGDTNATHWVTDKKSESFVLTFASAGDMVRNVRMIMVYQPFRYGSIEYIGYQAAEKATVSPTNANFLSLNISSILGESYNNTFLSITVEPPVALTHLLIRCKKELVIDSTAPISIAAVGLIREAT
eukprot:gene22344-30589_t